MKYSESVLPYLRGSTFSNALTVQLKGKDSSPYDRLDYLQAMSLGKRVLHIGFADHVELIEQKIRQETWLHKRLLASASDCTGFDINAEAVTFCRQVLHISDIYCHDLISDVALKQISKMQWDLVIIGEILEHLSSPVPFLSALKDKYGHCIDKIVITVPNAWNASNFFVALRSEEYINSDHRWWFTPYTLAKITTDAGLSPVEFQFLSHAGGNYSVLRFLQNRYPMLRPTILGVFAIK